jgi:hypothetical protein
MKDISPLIRPVQLHRADFFARSLALLTMGVCPTGMDDRPMRMVKNYILWFVNTGTTRVKNMGKNLLKNI